MQFPLGNQLTEFDSWCEDAFTPDGMRANPGANQINRHLCAGFRSDSF